MAKRHNGTALAESDLTWYKDAIIYELHVRAFHDSNGDGVGDFPGLTTRLDYIQDLGVTAIWLLPFYPSPLKDDGYDIADYTNVHPAYGTLHDFREFLHEAHERGLRVITELVLNHTSDRHPWFQRARRAKPGSLWRNFYVWHHTAEQFKEARIIFQDYETSNWAWDATAQAYYWHRFYSHQPDLNYESPQVRRAVFRIMDFWLGMGVDGMRLDAVPYLFEQEGTTCENLPPTHVLLKDLRRRIDTKFPNRMLLAEANQWPEDAVAYFGEDDECHMAFHFPLMPRLFMAVRMEERFPVVDILQQTPQLPERCQWALFLRNHDELTLETVTDEERDYMYRMYGHDPHTRFNLGIRRRLAPLLGNDRRRMELMNGLLCALPGTPVLYYGDEIGMGDNIYLGDRNGVRTPMQWSADRNAGFSRASPQKLYLPIIIEPEYHYEAINVEAQQNNPQSFLWWMKRLMALRKRFKAFSRGSLEFLFPSNHKVLVFLRRYQEECILVAANLSRYAQGIELDLSSFKDLVPVELFGRTAFPRITEARYFLTLGPHDFYWFALEPQPAGTRSLMGQEPPLPTLAMPETFEEYLHSQAKTALEAVLPPYLLARRWFVGKTRPIKSTTFLEVLPLPWVPEETFVTLVQVEYAEGEPDVYVLPLTAVWGEQAARMQEGFLHPLLACLQGRLTRAEAGETGLLCDALYDTRFSMALLDAIARHRRLRGAKGELVTVPTRIFRSHRRQAEPPLEPRVIRTDQSNTSVVYGDQFVLKFFRRLEAGVHPDLEMGRFLTERTTFAHTPPLAGAIEYRRNNGERSTLAVLHRFVPNQGDAWHYTLDTLSVYYDEALARQTDIQATLVPRKPLVALIDEALPELAQELLGSYLASVSLLGQYTAELHTALAQEVDDPVFAPEFFTTSSSRALYQSMRNRVAQVCQRLRGDLQDLPEAVQEEAQRVLSCEGEILKRYRLLVQSKILSGRIRVHGDYHLGQVLYTGKDFMIIDFEGDPDRPLSERRLKRSPLRDVASMLRSLHYAVRISLSTRFNGSLPSHDHMSVTETCAYFWYTWVSATFLRAYLEHAAPASLLPQSRPELAILLDAYLLDRAVYELGAEMNKQPMWAQVPLRGILELLEV